MEISWLVGAGTALVGGGLWTAHEPIADPVVAVTEVLILLSAPEIVTLAAGVRAWRTIRTAQRLNA
jgi:hypothetical protein